MEGLVMTGRQSTLEIVGIGERVCERRIGDAGVPVKEASGAHAHELPLQVMDDPSGRQRNRVPADADRKAGRQELEEPAWLDVRAWQSLDKPAAAETADVLETRGELAAESPAAAGRDGLAADSNLIERCLHARRV